MKAIILTILLFPLILMAQINVANNAVTLGGTVGFQLNGAATQWNDVVITSTGAMGTCNVMGHTILVGGAQRSFIVRGVVINTTVDNIIDLTYQWCAASAGNILINVTGTVQIFN